MRAGFAAAVIAVLLAAACNAVTPLDDSLSAGVITQEPPTDVYGLTVANGVVTSAAPTSNSGADNRIVFWRKVDASTVDQESCATWTAQDQNQQPGIALRIHDVTNGVRAITVTKNVWDYGYSIFGVHVMDSSNSSAPFVQIAGQDLPGLRNSSAWFDVKPYPWRACAQVVGTIVSLKVWPTVEDEPSWDDPDYGYSVQLPAGWGDPGYPGFYIGHLPPGGSLDHSDLVVSDLTTADVVAPRSPTHLVNSP